MDIPWGKLVVVTGPSGAGKSSLVFDAIYAESQRRFIETFSPYARQYLERLPRPAARSMENLPAAVAIEQKNPVRNARSTVGTLAELTWPARLLFFRLATLVCPQCGNPVEAQGPAHVAQYIDRLSRDTSDSRYAMLTVTVPGHRAAQMVRDGWFRCLEAGSVRRLDPDDVDIPGTESVEFVIDRFRLDSVGAQRVMESAEQAFSLGESMVHVVSDDGRRVTFSRGRHCASCNRHFTPPSPALFSFNSSAGACPECSGYGRVQTIDPDLVAPDPVLSIRLGAVKPFVTRAKWQKRLVSWCDEQGIDTRAPWGTLSEQARQEIFSGQGKWPGVQGFFRRLEKKRYKPHIRMLIARYRTYLTCPECQGGRFRPETLMYRLGGITIPEFYSLTIREGIGWCDRVISESSPDRAAMALLEDLRHRLEILERAGLSYLSMDRASRTLSGGEAARINMARAMGSRLTHTLYCVEEPSTGLHASDTMRIASVLRGLVQAGNSVIAVDNDPALVNAADMVIELGPGSGSNGGHIIFQGAPAAVMEQHGRSGKGEVREPDPMFAENGHAESRRQALCRVRGKDVYGGSIQLCGVSEHNLCSLDVHFPAGCITCISGVSGSGKSTLAEDVLFRSVRRKLGNPCERPGKHTSLFKPRHVSFALLVDQSPPSRSPRACPATTLGFFDVIRKIFAATPEAIDSGLASRSFSFNTADGRCQECKGQGCELVEMQFLPDLTLPCPGCGGKRFGPEVLKVKYRGRTIADVLDMTLSHAAEFFSDSSLLLRRVRPALELGLGHLQTGQALNTLSAGEMQRLKLAEYLQKGGRGITGLFILDEPTRGLHGSEVKMLIASLRRIAMQGNTVVVVEHDLEVIAASHHVIDLGPGGGTHGGRLLYQGSPAGLETCRESITGKMLRKARSAAFCAPSVREAQGAGPSCGGSVVQSHISIQGARHHNLKNISLDIPHGKLVVITGVSGSGKSTLAFDCIFSEGQRRYVEGLSSYMRQFVAMYQRPDVDRISGLTPSVAIDQMTSRAGPMATVATMTEIAHYLRLLYARVSVPWCIECDVPMSAMSRHEIAGAVMEKWRGERVLLAAPRVIRRKGLHRREIELGERQGIEMFLVDGKVCCPGEEGMPLLSRYSEHSIAWIVGEVVITDVSAGRVQDLVAQALEAGHGTLSVLSGSPGRETGYEQHFFSTSRACPCCAVGVQEPDPLIFSFNTPAGRCGQCAGRGVTSAGKTCPACRGSRLNVKARSWRIGSRAIDTVLHLEISQALQLMRQWLKHEPWASRLHDIAAPLVKSITGRLEFLEDVGLGYLTLDLAGDCLSGGEAQRIRLSAQAGSGLSGVTVVLDEPTIGLHPRDNARLISALKRLKQAGNSVIVVEHDEETLRCADWIVDLGPGGGRLGGKVVAQGSLEHVLSSGESATALALKDTGRKSLRPGRQIGPDSPMISVRGAACRNLKGVDVTFPAGAMTVVTGVSGAGKSTLVSEVIGPAVQHVLSGSAGSMPVCTGMDGAEYLKRVVTVDHSPIGKTPRSCPATYTGVWSEIRNLLSRVPDARNRGYGPGRFSFNLKGGRCEACAGQGSVRVSLGYLPDVFVLCEQCGGSRFEPGTLDIKWKGKSVSDILEMTMDEAREFFRPVPRILRIMSVACDLGLGYLTLGQPSPSLSGGEAQRLKLVRELVSARETSTLYLLDEPTTGLHIKDVELLVRHLQKLVAKGATVLVIEHNLDVISAADWIIDLGPGGGRYGGKMLFSGTPAAFLDSGPESATCQALGSHLHAV